LRTTTTTTIEGELKLKKSFDEERVVREFTHADLDYGPGLLQVSQLASSK
jgi:hypothetical protein